MISRHRSTASARQKESQDTSGDPSIVRTRGNRAFRAFVSPRHATLKRRSGGHPPEAKRPVIPYGDEQAAVG